MNKLMYNLAASLRAALTHIGEYKDGDGYAKFHVCGIGNEALGIFDELRSESETRSETYKDDAWKADLELNVSFEIDGREETVVELVNCDHDTTIGYGASDEGSRRIVACLNACRGISTKALESSQFSEGPDAWMNRPPTVPFRDTPMPADPMTIAYIAIGVKHVLDTYGGPLDTVVDNSGGELGFITPIVQHAAMLDEMGREAAGAHGLAGVFAYEVALPFGEAMAMGELDGTPKDPRKLAVELISHITAEAA